MSHQWHEMSEISLTFFFFYRCQCILSAMVFQVLLAAEQIKTISCTLDKKVKTCGVQNSTRSFFKKILWLTLSNKKRQTSEIFEVLCVRLILRVSYIKYRNFFNLR